MKILLNIIRNNKKKLTYIRDISQSKTYYISLNSKRQKFIDNASKRTSLSIYFEENKGLNSNERNFFRFQNI